MPRCEAQRHAGRESTTRRPGSPNPQGTHHFPTGIYDRGLDMLSALRLIPSSH
jgi:hypothetical protein